MLKRINNHIEIYEAQKKFDKLILLSQKPKSVFNRRPSIIDIGMSKKKLAILKQFPEYDVIICKHQSFGQFPFKFNGESKIILMPYADGENIILNYDQIKKVEIVPEQINQQVTHTTTKTKGGVVRSVIGGSLFGIAGAVVGSNTAKRESIASTTNITKFNNYKFCVWMKSGTIYYVDNIPVSGFFNKRPPKELLELEFYFNQIISDEITYLDFGESFPFENRSTQNINVDYAIKNENLKKNLKIKKIKKFLNLTFILSILSFAMFFLFLPYNSTLQLFTTNVARKISGLPKMSQLPTKLDEVNGGIVNTNLLSFLKFEDGPPTELGDGKTIINAFSNWKLTSGEKLGMIYVTGPLTTDVSKYEEQFGHNNQDLLLWNFSNDLGTKKFYYEIDELNFSINLWYHYSDKKFKNQQEPHITLSIIDNSEDTMTFNVKNYWMPNNQILKDGTYVATRENQ